MKITRFKYVIYVLSMIAVIFFFLMSFYPKEMEVPTLIFAISTILLYFSYSVVIKEETKFEFLCDSIMFITFNLIGFALDSFYTMLGLNAILIYLLNFLLCVLFIIAYISSLSALFRKRFIKKDFPGNIVKNKFSNTEVEKQFVKKLGSNN